MIKRTILVIKMTLFSELDVAFAGLLGGPFLVHFGLILEMKNLGHCEKKYFNKHFQGPKVQN